MRPIPGRIPVFLLRKGAGKETPFSAMAAPHFTVAVSELLPSTLSGYNNRGALFWFGREKKIFSIYTFSPEKGEWVRILLRFRLYICRKKKSIN